MTPITGYSQYVTVTVTISHDAEKNVEDTRTTISYNIANVCWSYR